MAAENQPFALRGLFLVTGGTRGIGRAISERFARAGAHVLANYVRNEQAAGELQALAQADGLALETLRADLAAPRGLESVVARVKDGGMPLAGIVHCAATGTHRTIESLTGRHLDWTFALNVRVPFELTTQLLPHFGRDGCILAISSMGATRALPHYTAVGASKGALDALIRHFAAELAPRGIRANLLRPGAVRTEAWKAMPDAEQRLAEAAARTPGGRLVTPEELACAAQFLCSPAAAGVNGQALVVDGGAAIVY
ncbi:MAG: SDR family oxidoreductase [Proteobacteria bacterium]|nr:SDR family oxidoreductase [Pseudomonadota bacterium]